MAWLSRVNFTASDVLSYTDLNNLGNDIRAWGGNVNGGGYTLSNVILSASSGTMATIIGGTGTTSTLTLRSTSGVGTTGADIIFQAGNNGATEVMRLQNGGNVGIGTSSPDALLTVNTIASFGDGAVTTPSIAHKGDLNTGFWFPAADVIATSTAGSERMRIDSSGNVGINAIPQTRLHVVLGSSIASVPAAGTYGGAAIFGNHVSTYGMYVGTIASGDGYIQSQSGSSATTYNLLLQPNGGNVGIGTSSTGFNSSGLPLVVGSGSGNTGMTIYSGSSSFGSLHFADTVTTGGGSYSGYINYAHNANSMQFGTNATEAMRIDSSGNVGIGTTSVATSAKLEIAGTTGALLVPRLTTTERNSLTAVNGMIIYNTTDNQMQGRINGAWVAM